MAFQSKMTHARLMCGAAAAAVIAFSGAAQAQENTTTITIAPQSLATALYEFGGQTGRQVLFTPNIAEAKVTRGVVGATDQQVALAQLLEGTGLSYRRTGDTYLIVQGGSDSPQSGSAAGDGAEVEALIVTAQKKEEDIQDVPIAISAFTQKSLDAQKIEGGFDLLKAIPNVTFSKNNFSGYNFSIRGIGTKAVSATTDPGVAVSFNNSSLIVNRLFEQEYFDVERVEVLRGPQGTLYGRNATSGVINVLSARPRMGEFEGDIKLEAGNYNARRARGMINIPLGDTFAVRLAGALTKRDGYGINEAADNALADVTPDVDDRDLWSARMTVGWEPTENFRANLLWEHFEEDDSRVRTSKQLCHHDPGPQTIGGFDWADSQIAPFLVDMSRGMTSQGCLPGSLYDDGAYGTPNGLALPYVSGLFWGSFWGLFSGVYTLGFVDPAAGACEVLRSDEAIFIFPLDLCQPDPYANQVQTKDLRSINSLIQPIYRAKADVYEFSFDYDIGDALTLTSQTVYNKDEYYATQDFNRFTTFPIFSDSTLGCEFPATPCPNMPYAGGYYYDLTPGGYFTDPQLGTSNTLVAQDLSKAVSEQFNQEFRLASSFAGPVNFSLGANYTEFETLNDYYIFANALTLFSNLWPFNSHIGCHGIPGTDPCIYVDPNPLEQINGEGHNYFRSANPYDLQSYAVFGELYWQVAETLKVTVGARMTWDRKVFTPIPSQLLLWDYRQVWGIPDDASPEVCTNPEYCKLAGTGVGGRGSPPGPQIRQKWREPTGRVVIDWKPDLSFTDETMMYWSIAHGYKGGGANPPGIAAPAGIFNAKNSGIAAPPTFEPEFIDAMELGSKNVLLGGALVLNGAAFIYDYEGYQVSKIVDRSAANENFDARVWGVELEWMFSPTRNLRLNGTIGHLGTKIAAHERSLDLMDRTQSNRYSFTSVDGRTYSEWVTLKSWVSNASNCIAPAEIVGAMLAVGENGNLLNLCAGGGVLGFQYIHNTVPGYGLTYDPSIHAPNNGAGFYAPLGGNELPNAPHWTASLGAQYRFQLPAGWEATLRGDFYWQGESFARVYNTEYDRLREWTNTNISLWVENPDWGVTAEVYVKNAFDEEPITDAFLNSDDTGLTTNVFTLDPRLIGVSVTKRF